MNALDIQVGRTYATAKPAPAGATFLHKGFLNDRQVLWISEDRQWVQYDSPAIAFGRRYRKVDMAVFAAWAAEDVTDKMPKDEWRPVP